MCVEGKIILDPKIKTGHVPLLKIKMYFFLERNVGRLLRRFFEKLLKYSFRVEINLLVGSIKIE